MFCLDSDFIIEVVRGNPRALALRRRLEGQGPLHVSAISVFEVTDTKRPRERELLLDVVGTLDIEPVDASIAIAASGLAQAFRRRGQEVPPQDLLIGATCVLRDLTLVTRNRRHFGRVAGLCLESW